MQKFLCAEMLLGKKAMHRLENAFVILFGLGAVGSYAAETLVRSGLGCIRLVDFDKIKPTNFNRHLYALESNVGRLKVECGRERLLEINPHCKVEALPEFAGPENLDSLLSGNPSLVIDAIDSLNPKTFLLKTCLEREVPVIASMGAARRQNVFAIRSGDLFKVQGCALARELRSRFRRLGIKKKLLCIYSEEVPPKETQVSQEDLGEDEYPRGRARQKMGSLATVTGIFGLTLAHCAIQQIIHRE